VATRSQGRWGERLEEANAMRGSADGYRVTPPRSERILRMRKPLKSLAGSGFFLAESKPVNQNGTKGRSCRETCPLPERENL
jgi:hypothetical protein